jgi:phytoene synthase
VSAKVRDLLKFQGERARQYYRRAEQVLPDADARGMVAARIMAAIYLDLLKAIERANYDVFSGPIRVRRARQALLAAVTWLKPGGASKQLQQ